MQIVRSSDYGWQGLRSDVMSAIVVSVAGIPKAMSYAALCGLPFAQGIPTLYVPCLVYFLFGSSRQGCMSPLSVPCLMLAEMLDQALGETQLEAAELMSERMRLALVYTALTGLVIFCFGVLQLGFLLHFVPKPVLSGFVSASAFIAALAALKGLLKIHVEKSQVLYVLAGNVYEALPETHLPTAVMSVLSITMLVFLPMLQKRIVKKTTGSNAFCSRVMNKACRLPTILLLVASGLLFGATLCDFAPLTPWAPKHIVLGRGATLPALVLQETAEQFNCSFSDERVGAIYTATGSKDGIDAITSDDLKADFAISDIEPSPEVMKQHGLSSIPITSSAICPVINLPLLDNHRNAEFILDLPTVADIFEGRITHWTDRRIRSLNPNLRWYAAPDDIPIVVVSRSDASGTTFSFANMLKNCSTCNSSISPGFEVAWGAPVQASQVGTSGVVRAVAEIDWSIGYAGLAAVEDGQTTHPESPIRCAALRTSTGVVSAALDSVSSVNGQHGAWPLTVYSYMLIPSVGLLAKSSFPRVGSCEARSFLKSFTKEFFTLEASSTARGTNILQAPLLDHIECKSNATAGNAKGRNLRSEAAQGFLSPQNRPVGVASILSDASLRRLKDDECSKRSFLCGTFKVVGFIEVSLPAPNWLFGQDGATEVPVSEMLMGAFLLAIVTLLEHVANVKLYSDRNDYQVSTSGDLMALGLSNIVGSMFGSFLVAAGFSRSALNANAKSQLALALSTAISFGIVFLMAPLLSMLPDFILNAILFVAVISLVDYRMVKELFRLRGVGGEFDLVALCIAFVATCCLGVVMGMMISIAFSLVTFIFNASYPRILELRRRLGETNYCAIELPPTGCLPMSSNQDKTPGEPTDIAQERIKVLRFEAPMWFANVHHLTDRVLVELKANAAKPLHSQWNAIVLDMSTVPWLDASAGMALKKLVTVAKTYNTDVLFACVAENAQGMIRANCDGHWCDQCYTTIYDAAAACHESKPIGRAQSQERML
jgi:MFS superfamily sulfate permease-like transporter